MNINEQIDALTFDIDSLLARYVQEFDLNALTIVGILEQKKQDLIDEYRLEIELDDFDIEDDEDVF